MVPDSQQRYIVRLQNADVFLSGKQVLNNIDWCIACDQHWRIDGPNGAGKTTLLKTIAGLIWPVAKSPPSRLYCISGKISHRLIGVRQRIGFAGYGMQDDYVRAMRNLTCQDVISSGFEQNIMMYNRITASQQQSLGRICNDLELSKSELALPFASTSHGQKSVIFFARAIVHRPRLLVLDEIFNGVDHRRFKLMVKVLHDFRQRGGQICLAWHEHCVDEIEALFTDRLYLRGGRVVRVSKSVEVPGNISATDLRSSGLQLKLPAGNDILIELKNVNVFLGNRPVLKNINWTLRKAERWLLKGDNGAGKTTLLKTLLAEIRPSVGSVIRRKGFSARTSVWQIRKLIGYVSPELQQSYRYNISVFEAVASGFFSSIGLYDKVNRTQAKAIERQLRNFGLDDLADLGVHEISSGQMRRVLMARAMVINPEILILDEITANLDQMSRLTILRLIANLAAEGKTMILVSHYCQEVSGLYNRVLELDDGKIISSGQPQAELDTTNECI